MKKPRLLEKLETTVRVVRTRYVVEPPPSERPPRVVQAEGEELTGPKPVLAKCGEVVPFPLARRVAG